MQVLCVLDFLLKNIDEVRKAEYRSEGSEQAKNQNKSFHSYCKQLSYQQRLLGLGSCVRKLGVLRVVRLPDSVEVTKTNIVLWVAEKVE